MSKKTLKYKESRSINENWYYLIPIIFAMAVIPLIVYMKVYTVEGIQFEFWTGKKDMPDFFSYYKSIWIIVSAVVGLILTIFLKISDQIHMKKTKYYIFMGVYAIFIILSTLMAEYKDVALYGFVDRFEGMFVLLSYIAIMFTTINLINSEKHIKVITISLVGSAIIIGIIGVFQYLGYDVLRTNTGKLLMLPSNYHHIAKDLNFAFGKYSIYATLYNINYVGSYGAMLLLLSLGLLLYFKDKRLKILSGVFSVLMIILWIGSNSRAGYVGGMFGLALFIILMRKNIKNHWKGIVSIMVVLVVCVVAINSFSGGRVFREFSTLNIFAGKQDTKNDTNDQVPSRINDITLKDETARIVTDKGAITISFENKKIKFLDENDEAIGFTKDGGTLKLKDEKYKSYSFLIDEKKGYIRAQVARYDIDLAITNDGFKIIGRHGKLRDIDYPEALGFEGNERFGSGRGYIWSRSIPMLKDTVLVGHGPDTYAIYFPQEDYVGKLNGLGSMRKIVDKPHNLYLQIGINTGVISLLAVLAMFGMYFFSSLKIYLKTSMTSFKEIMGASIFTAFSGYCVAGMFNDSVVSVAPVFWVLFGLGISINMMVEKEMREAKDVKA